MIEWSKAQYIETVGKVNAHSNLLITLNSITELSESTSWE